MHSILVGLIMLRRDGVKRPREEVLAQTPFAGELHVGPWQCADLRAQLPYTVEGITYPSLMQASRESGINHRTIARRVEEGRPGYSKLAPISRPKSVPAVPVDGARAGYVTISLRDYLHQREPVLRRKRQRRLV